jgi:hypothetical protein
MYLESTLYPWIFVFTKRRDVAPQLILAMREIRTHRQTIFFHYMIFWSCELLLPSRGVLMVIKFWTLFKFFLYQPWKTKFQIFGFISCTWSPQTCFQFNLASVFTYLVKLLVHVSLAFHACQNNSTHHLMGTIQIMEIVSLFWSKLVGQQGAKLVIKELVSYVPQ